MGALFGVGVVWHVGWCGVTSHVGYVSVFSLHIDFISVYCAPTILRTVWGPTFESNSPSLSLLSLRLRRQGHLILLYRRKENTNLPPTELRRRRLLRSFRSHVAADE